ncbi:protein argonaute MEL1-like [Actinidia eriantha]|uniref:protein argonaute MEL1-like n=1 Tax=Actinidia eriantha TaxID=165200 RepID=UPI00258B3FA1|nr:protein argonaute MEL1-like [Actinidia eriantha]
MANHIVSLNCILGPFSTFNDALRTITNAASIVCTTSSASSSSKPFRPPVRPGFGSISVDAVQANHFLVEVADKDLHNYNVSARDWYIGNWHKVRGWYSHDCRVAAQK